MSPDPENVQLALLLWDLVRQGGAWGRRPLSRPLSQFQGAPNHRHRDPAHLSLGPPAPLGRQAWVTRRHSPCGQQGPLWLHTAHTGPSTHKHTAPKRMYMRTPIRSHTQSVDTCMHTPAPAEPAWWRGFGGGAGRTPSQASVLAHGTTDQMPLPTSVPSTAAPGHPSPCG